MNLITTVDPNLLVRWSAVYAHVTSWKAAILFLGGLVIGVVGRLLAEWQRRKTLVDVIQRAPSGTVIVQGRGRGGPAMRIEVGPGSSHCLNQHTLSSDR
jgi:hypothetical protein